MEPRAGTAKVTGCYRLFDLVVFLPDDFLVAAFFFFAMALYLLSMTDKFTHRQNSRQRFFCTGASFFATAPPAHPARHARGSDVLARADALKFDARGVR